MFLSVITAPIVLARTIGFLIRGCNVNRIDILQIRSATPIQDMNMSAPIQGGSDKSGPLSKLLNCIKNMSFLFFLSSQTGSAVCRSVNKKKKTHSSKDEARGRYKSRDCLRASRRTYHKEIMSYGNTKRALFTMLKKSLKN
jgi:hypothetical protein